MRAALVAALLLSPAACGPDPGGGPPEPDTCSAPRVPTGEFSVEVGDDTPWVDGEVVMLELGGQGFRMLPVVTFLSGDDIPACVRQDLDVRVDGLDAGGAVYDLRFARRADGTHVTAPVWVVVFNAYAGAEITITVQIAGRGVSRRLVAAFQ